MCAAPARVPSPTARREKRLLLQLVWRWPCCGATAEATAWGLTRACISYLAKHDDEPSFLLLPAYLIDSESWHEQLDERLAGKNLWLNIISRGCDVLSWSGLSNSPHHPSLWSPLQREDFFYFLIVNCNCTGCMELGFHLTMSRFCDMIRAKEVLTCWL